MKNKLEAVMVSVDYSDILEIVLNENINIFDHIVVVTTPKDKKTQKICKKYNCTTVLTDCFYDDGCTFNKGKAINIGYKYLKYKDWVVNIDSDIVLFKNFKELFFNIPKLDKEKLYWSKRIIFKNKTEWDVFLQTGACKKPKEEEDALGFLQIFNYNSKVFTLLRKYNNDNPYFEFSCDASQSDLEFKNKWNIKLRPMLKIPCYHLGEYEKNWNGRVTLKFI